MTNKRNVVKNIAVMSPLCQLLCFVLTVCYSAPVSHSGPEEVESYNLPLTTTEFGAASRELTDNSEDNNVQLDMTNDVIPPQGGQAAYYYGATHPAAKRWPGGKVPYVISSDFSDTQRQEIAAAMSRYHKQTCIRFVARTTESNYVHFKPGSGCGSKVGMQGTGGQPVDLGPKCNIYAIQHELMHALGFIHEHQRPDRDKYVRILKENIKPKYALVFYLQVGLASLGSKTYTPYDYDSIMHYKSTIMGKDGKPTILPIDPSIDPKRLGQTKGFSKLDIVAIQKAYQC